MLVYFEKCLQAEVSHHTMVFAIGLIHNTIRNYQIGCNDNLPVKATFWVSIQSVKSSHELAIALISSSLSFQEKIWCAAVSVMFELKVIVKKIICISGRNIKLVITFFTWNYTSLY